MIVDATISLPGDKSISHRSIMLASIANGFSHIRNLNDGEDLQSTINAMRSCGVHIEENDGEIQVKGRSLENPTQPIDCVMTVLILFFVLRIPGVRIQVSGFAPKPPKKSIEVWLITGKELVGKGAGGVRKCDPVLFAAQRVGLDSVCYR